VVALFNFGTGNFHNFAPTGVDGITSASAIIFFAYIGFDAVSTGSEEARNPARDLPLAIIGSLIICTIFYVLTAVGALGIASPDVLQHSDAPLAAALDKGAGIGWAGAILALGAVIAITSVVLVILRAGQHRSDHPAPDQAGDAPAVPGAVVAGPAGDRRGLRGLLDARPAPDHLDPVRGVAGDRPDHLLAVRLPELPAPAPGRGQPR
jgi:hypothetical protein